MANALGILLPFLVLSGTIYCTPPRTAYRREHARELWGRSLTDCPRLGESCSGVPKCCGRNQCYYEDGYRLFRSGVCVLCVEEGKPCQFHDNCCGEHICFKDGDYKTNGRCQPPLEEGIKCWEDEQCVSGSCTDSTFKASGVCTG